jgi:hypothetical protein
MKRIIGCAGLAVALTFAVPASAQVVQNPPREASTLNHGDFSVYGDLFRVSPKSYPTLNFLGLGGRVGFNVHPNVALEGEMNYDFEQNYTSISGTSGSSTTITSGVRPLTGLFGPRFQFGTSGPFRAFVTGKAGFIEWSTSGKAPSGTTFADSFGQFGGNSTMFAAYPGGGIEAYMGPLGIRVEAGDEVYLNNGPHNNLRVTFGPSIRF